LHSRNGPSGTWSLVAAWAVQELDSGPRPCSGRRPRAGDGRRQRGTRRSRTARPAADRRHAAGSTSRAASTRSTVKTKAVASEADRVAPGQLAQGAARTVEVGAVDVGDEVLGAATSGRLLPSAGPGRRDRVRGRCPRPGGGGTPQRKDGSGSAASATASARAIM